MPAIIVSDYTWRQTTETVIISMRLVGHPKKIDLFAIHNYMKASYCPFILELFLWAEIVEEESECTISEETAFFTLKKAEIGVEWPSLVTEGLDNDKKRARRFRALELARESAEQRAKARTAKRRALEKEAVRAQMDLDTATLNEISALRDSHRREAMTELENWRKNAEKPILEGITGTVQENRKSYKAPLKWLKDETRPAIINKKPDDSEQSGDRKKADQKATLIDTSKERDPSVNDANVVGTAMSDVKVDPVNEAAKDEPKRLLSARKNRDSTRGRTLSSSSDSSNSDGDNDEPRVSGSKSPINRCSIKEIDDEELREYYLDREKKNSQRVENLVQRLLNGKTGCKAGGRNERIFDDSEVPAPRPRSSCTIDVKFSERHFPTPARESSRLEEQEWLEKQAEARRKSGFVSEDLRAEEQDPQWLKDKGDELFKAGNYLGAISAYSHGIRLSDKMSSLYVNRSAAHYAAKNYHKCAEDSSTALQLMIPKCEGNRDSRARCHARLGAALCKLSAPQHGIPELEAALKLTPEDETIKRDLTMAKRYFEIKD